MTMARLSPVLPMPPRSSHLASPPFPSCSPPSQLSSPLRAPARPLDSHPLSHPLAVSSDGGCFVVLQPFPSRPLPSPSRPPPTPSTAWGMEAAEDIARCDAWWKVNILSGDAASSEAETSEMCVSKEIGEMQRGHTLKPKFNCHDFPSLKVTDHLKQRKKCGPPFDTVDWNFKYSAHRKDFPFDQVVDEALKIKFLPIRLQWASN